MARHNGMKFTTIDVDNDLKSSQNCAVYQAFGGWWYKACAYANLNGKFGTVSTNGAIYWRSWQRYKALKTTSMMIKRHP